VLWEVIAAATPISKLALKQFHPLLLESLPSASELGCFYGFLLDGERLGSWVLA
jgi:hypothetical protein